MQPKYSFAAAVLFFVSVGANAQTPRPGLWEINNKMQMGQELAREMAQMKEQMASMPPEQRKMMEDMLAKQGVSMGAGGSPAVSVRICISKEMAERDEIPAAQGDCKNKVLPRAGNTMKFSFSCTNPQSSGEGQITFLSPEAYTTKVSVDTMVQGKPEKIDVDGSSRWLSADCGAVKVVPAAKK